MSPSSTRPDGRSSVWFRRRAASGIPVAMVFLLPATGRQAGANPEINIEQPAGNLLEGAGRLVAWGLNEEGQTSIPPEAETGVQAIAAGKGHSVALKRNGKVLAWGYDFYGQTIVPAAAQADVVAIAAGEEHTVALKSDGSVLAWGESIPLYGQTIVPAAARSEVVAIAAGNYHTVALKNDGSVLAWGYNSWLQSQVPVAAQSGVVAIAGGWQHTVVLKNDGSVLAWGNNWHGQISVPVAAQSGVAAIAAGEDHTVALKSDGSVIAWGHNGRGQSSVPLSAQSGVVAISAGYMHTVALKSDGSVVAWGLTGVPEEAQSGMAAIAAGGYHTVGLKGSFIGFGSQPPGTSTTAKNFTIKNAGTDALEIASVNVTGPHASDFVVNTSGMSASLPLNTDETTFTVAFSPTATGSRRAILRIESNDDDEGTFDIPLTGTGVTPLESWRLLHFGTASNTGPSAADADPNGNTIPNLMEYALGGDPAGSTTGASILPRVLPGEEGRVRLAFDRLPDRTDITLTVQASDSPAGPWTDVGRSTNGGVFTVLVDGAVAQESGDGNTRAVTISDVYPATDPAHPRRFMRLQVAAP